MYSKSYNHNWFVINSTRRRRKKGIPMGTIALVGGAVLAFILLKPSVAQASSVTPGSFILPTV